jgi:hypothetical protein
MGIHKYVISAEGEKKKEVRRKGEGVSEESCHFSPII